MILPNARCGHRRLVSACLALAVTLAGAAVGGPALAQPADSGTGEGPSPTVIGSYLVTLVTGDQVVMDRLSDGGHQVTVSASGATERTGVWFQTIDDGDQVYVLPSDAAPLVGDLLDQELFNVTKLAEAGFTDGVPVIVTGATGPAAFAAESGRSSVRELASIDAVSFTVDRAGHWWRATESGSVVAPLRADAAAPQVWLDEPVSIALAESVGMVGAPAAWDAGWDGTGVRVAVLDTGVDADHPDVRGSVVAAADFTDSGSPTDRHGHGTHVAATIAGSGDASGGARAGVAPGAELLNAKVLNDAGSGASSGIIAGMEWAVGQGADVLNLSLGGPGGDGTDPLSQAVDRLTAEHDVLFAVAAGNSGPGEHTINSPGTADAALTVGSVDKHGGLAGSSSRGPRWGDFSIKPELTAPGVGIVAARAAGTSLGSPVDEHYTSLSGTSMATPHVAGAAAIMWQAEPELSALELKQRLVGSAVPLAGVDVYQQGGGRLDIPAALAAPVRLSPAPLDLGYFAYPHDGLGPETTEVTATNQTDEPVTVALSVSARSREGAVTSPEMLSVTPASVTVPAGGEVTVSVTVDATAGSYGLYSGSLAAEVAGEPVARAPLGFYYESERYALTVVGVASDGRPAGGNSLISVLDVENMARYMRPANSFSNGELRLRLPPGTYAVVGNISTYDAYDRDIQQTAFVGDPELSLHEDTTLVLDAREATPVSVTAPEPAAVPLGSIGAGFMRTAAQPGPLLGMAWVGLHSGQEIAATSTEAVTMGEFEFYTRYRMAEPQALLSMVDPEVREYDPVLVRAPAVDGEQLVRLVDAGAGAAEDFHGRDVEGAAVLTRRGEVSLPDQEAHAAAAGAVALIVSNDVPGPLVGQLTDPGTIPTLSLPMVAGDELRDRLAEGEVTLRLAGTVWSPYLYDLLQVEVGQIGDELAYRPAPEQLAALDVSYHNDVADHVMTDVRHFRRPFHSSSVYLHPPIEGPQERREYVVAGLADYLQVVYGETPLAAPLYQPGYRGYTAGEVTTTSFFRQVVRPALLPGVGTTRRTGNQLHLEVYEWVDAAGNHFPEIYGLAPYPGDDTSLRLYQDGELVAEAAKPRGTFPLAAEPAEYTVDLTVAREAEWWQRSTNTHTSWTFESQHTAAATVLPLLSIDYLVEVDLWNTVPGPGQRSGPPVFEFQVAQQSPELPAIAGAELWLSYDDGERWQSRPVRHTGDGHFEAVLPHRPPQVGTGFTSVRVVAWDVDGNQVDQVVIRAWRQ